MYYKTPTNEIIKINPHQIRLVQSNWIEITEAEANAILNPPKTLDQIKSDFLSAIQTHLDSSARMHGYDDIKSAALRAGLPNSPFHNEGVSFGTWMDQCWSYSYQELAKVESGERSIPTPEEFIAELPELVLP